MFYRIVGDGTGLTVTDKEELAKNLHLKFDKALIDGKITVETARGRSVHTIAANGVCKIPSAELDGIVRLAIRHCEHGVIKTIRCEALKVETMPNGTKIVSPCETDKLVAELYEANLKMQATISTLLARMSELTEKVDAAIDGHDFL